MYFHKLSSNFFATYNFASVAVMPTTGTMNNGADVTIFLPHSPVPIVTSKLLGSPLIVISVLLLAPAIVLNASDFLA